MNRLRVPAESALPPTKAGQVTATERLGKLRLLT